MKPIFLLLVMLLLAGCSRHASLTVVNETAVELTNVVASGSGFSVSLGTIPAGKEKRVPVIPKGESSVQLSFDAAGKHLTSAPDGYFESGGQYKVTATVSKDFSVKVKTDL
jgi:hypothetical protein